MLSFLDTMTRVRILKTKRLSTSNKHQLKKQTIMTVNESYRNNITNRQLLSRSKFLSQPIPLWFNYFTSLQIFFKSKVFTSYIEIYRTYCGICLPSQVYFAYFNRLKLY